ncbi:helix-turn-helix domain-containing protein [Escherichia coli]|uniref:helix-turn-helix domain-containing protein n=1 Tax=Escherichia coli TaxID=562 RepID=UPI000B7DF9ED|nr:helix-turn-helix domain-containing protein [Escherichia coli]
MKDKYSELNLSLINKIRQNLKYDHKMQVKNISKISGYSIKYTQQIFFKKNGITIGKYIKKSILSKGAILLVLTKRDVIDISLELGYTSQQSFTRAFKNEFLLPPVRYRKRGILVGLSIIEKNVNKKFICLGKKYLISIHQKASHMRFFDTLLNGGEIKIREQRLKAIMHSLKYDNSVIISSKLIPSLKKTNEIYIDSFVFYKNSCGHDRTALGQEYWRIKFDGCLTDYIESGRDIVFFIHKPFSKNIVEIFTKTSCNTLDIEIYIPIVDDL